MFLYGVIVVVEAYNPVKIEVRGRYPHDTQNKWSCGRCGHCAGLKIQRNEIVTRQLHYDLVAQLVELLTLNQKVVGPTPTRITELKLIW